MASEPTPLGYDDLPGPGKLNDPHTRERFQQAHHQLLTDPPALAAARKHMFTAAELQEMTFAEPKSYIEGLIHEGFGIFGGKPKLGKSWWALGASFTIATGGVAFGNPHRGVTQAPVLYLALEDGRRRLQDRSKVLLPGEQWPVDLTYSEQWPALDKGGIDLLDEAVDADGYRVVFIDTLGRVRTGRPRRGDAYQEDTDAMTGLHDLTREKPGLAIYVIHHNRKDDHPDDYIDALSGTTGISGVVDHIAVLQRGRGEADAVLKFTSRDAPEHETAFGFDAGQWTELGSAAIVELSKARRAVLAAVEELGSRASLTDIAELAKRDKANTLRLLRGLESEGLVRQDDKRGPWNLHNTHNNDNSEPAELLSELSELTGF